MPRDDRPRFRISPDVFRALDVRPYRPGPGEPNTRPLRVFARDPSTSRLDGAVVTLEVPYEPLEPGPKGQLLHVVDRAQVMPGRETIELFYEPVDLETRFVLLDSGLPPGTGDPHFGQQMVYAVCSQVYDRFRRALGRDPAWGFDRPDEGPRDEDRGILVIRPHAFDRENAYYDPTAGELAFGFYSARAEAAGRNQEKSHVFTCLSHDIVVHEMSHALLDGMRRLFTVETRLDVPAFHEGFADLVAIFQRFSYRQNVELAIARTGGRLDDGLLVDVATQFGQTTSNGNDGALRSAIPRGEDLETPPEKLLRYDSPDHDAHSLGSVLVAAVFEAYRRVYRRKSADLLRLAGMDPRRPNSDGPLDEILVERLAHEAGKLAEQFLNIIVRAVDYCPPVDLTFGEYLRAMVTADADLVPEDPWAYREALVDAFRRRRVVVPEVPDLSEKSLLWRPPDESLDKARGLEFGERKFAHSPSRVASRAELERQARTLGRFVSRHDHLWYFGLIEPGHRVLEGDHVDPPTIQSLRSVQRVGPDRQPAYDLVAEVVQRRVLQDSGSSFYGGATVILGPDGQIRYTVRKNVGSYRRVNQFRRYIRGQPPSDGGTFFRNLCGRSATIRASRD